MGKYNLITIRPKGFIHSSAFQEVKDSLAWSLTELGHEVILTENAWAVTGTNVLFGGELLSPTSNIPENTIVLNMEQPSHPRMDNVRRLAKGHQVWEIYQSSMPDWKRLGVDARFLQIGYTPNLTRIPPSDKQDIDIFFAGWMTPRRTKIIRDLESAGLKVHASDCCYGGARDQIISRSKVCLNIHHDGRDLFEIVRVSYLLANGKLVLTEPSSDDGYHNDLVPSLEFSAYGDIVKRCEELLDRYEDIAPDVPVDRCFAERNFAASVDRVLQGNKEFIPGLDKIRLRYEQGCQQGDMKDFLPMLRGLAKGRILEIGVRDGASTSAFLLGLEDRDPFGSLHSIDIQDCSSLWQHKQWNFTQADSKKLEYPEHHFDLALIDGDHSREGFLADLHNCLRWVRPGGVILCHDITPIPNYTNEARGGDWPSEYVGEEFFAQCKYHNLRHFVFPGAWGMGVIINNRYMDNAEAEAEFERSLPVSR